MGTRMPLHAPLCLQGIGLLWTHRLATTGNLGELVLNPHEKGSLSDPSPGPAGATGPCLGVPRLLGCLLPVGGLLVRARELLLARGELLAPEQAPNQRSKFLLGQRCKLQQAGVPTLELAFRHRVEVDTTNPLLSTRTLQPTKENQGRLRLSARDSKLRGGTRRRPSSCSRARTTSSRPARRRRARARPARRGRCRQSRRALPSPRAAAPALPPTWRRDPHPEHRGHAPSVASATRLPHRVLRTARCAVSVGGLTLCAHCKGCPSAPTSIPGRKMMGCRMRTVTSEPSGTRVPFGGVNERTAKSPSVTSCVSTVR